MYPRHAVTHGRLRCATCRRLIRTGDTDVCRDPRPHNESAIALLAGERLEGDLLRAALSKEAALIICLPLAAAALLMAGTFGLALATGGQPAEGKSRRLRWNEMGCLARALDSAKPQSSCR